MCACVTECVHACVCARDRVCACVHLCMCVCVCVSLSLSLSPSLSLSLSPSLRGIISLAWNFRFAVKTTVRLKEQAVTRHSPRHLDTKIMSHDTSHSNKNTPQEQRQLHSEAVKSRAKPIVYQRVLSQTSHSKHHPKGNNGSPVEQLRHETLCCPPQASSPRDQGTCHLQTSSRRESPSSDNPAAILQMIAQLLVPIYQSA